MTSKIHVDIWNRWDGGTRVKEGQLFCATFCKVCEQDCLWQLYFKPDHSKEVGNPNYPDHQSSFYLSMNGIIWSLVDIIYCAMLFSLQVNFKKASKEYRLELVETGLFGSIFP